MAQTNRHSHHNPRHPAVALVQPQAAEHHKPWVSQRRRLEWVEGTKVSRLDAELLPPSVVAPQEGKDQLQLHGRGRQHLVSTNPPLILKEQPEQQAHQRPATNRRIIND